MRLRPMTATEYDRWRQRLIVEYANEQVAAGTWSADDAEARSAQGMDEGLPDGLDTADALILTAEDDQGPVGVLWLSLTHPRGTPDTGWINDIEIVAERRGEGLGRELLAAAEREIKDHGLSALGLNVFGNNHVARHLYESAGYAVVHQNMRKRLT